MRLASLLSAVAALAALLVATPPARAQEGDIPAENVDKDQEPKKPAEGEDKTPDKGDNKPEEKPSDIGNWGVGGKESEGKFKPHGKTGKLKELEEAREERRKAAEEPLDIGRPGWAYLDTVVAPSGTIVVPNYTDRTSIKPGASFILGVGYRIFNKYELGARFGVSSASIAGPACSYCISGNNPEAFKQIATGNLEVGFRPFFNITQALVAIPGLALVIPTAQGDPFTDPDNRGQLARAIVNQAAAAMRGWQDVALFAPHRFGITPSFSVMWQRTVGPGKIVVDARTKAEIMVLAGGNDPSVDPSIPAGTGVNKTVAVNWLLGAGAHYAMWDGLLQAGLKLWNAYLTPAYSVGSVNVSGDQFVFEFPDIRTHLPFTADKKTGLDGSLSFILPVPGPLGANSTYGPGNETSIWGLRIAAGVFF